MLPRENKTSYLKRVLFPCKGRIDQLLEVHKAACDTTLCAVAENTATRSEMMQMVKASPRV